MDNITETPKMVNNGSRPPPLGESTATIVLSKYCILLFSATTCRCEKNYSYSVEKARVLFLPNSRGGGGGGGGGIFGLGE